MSVDFECLRVLDGVLPDLKLAAEQFIGSGKKARDAYKAINRGKLTKEDFHCLVFFKVQDLQDAIVELEQASAHLTIDAKEHTANTLDAVVHFLGGKNGLISNTQRSTTFDPTVIQQRYPACPPGSIREELKEALDVCCQVLRACTSFRSPAGDLETRFRKKAKLKQPWSKADDIWSGIDRLHSTLYPFLPCYCPFPHDTKLCVGAFETEHEGVQLAVEMMNRKPRAWVLAKMMRDPGFTTVSLPQAQSLCHAIASRETYIHLDDYRLTIPSLGNQLPDSSVELVSLRDMKISDPAGFSVWNKKDRIVLSLLLSYAYLYLNGGGWWSDQDIDPNFWFTKVDTASKPIYTQPFMTSNTDPKAYESATCRIEGFLSPNRPSLPAFGKLLLEIWLGHTVSWDNLESAQKECNEDDLGKYFHFAIIPCLSSAYRIRSRGSLNLDERMRAEFLDCVVKTLHYILEEIYLTSLDDIFQHRSKKRSMNSNNSNTSEALISFAKAPLLEQTHQTDRRDSRFLRTVGDDSPSREIRSKNLAFRIATPKVASCDAPYHTLATRIQETKDLPRRMINVHTLKIDDITSVDIEYSVLSHTWGSAEVTFQDWDSEHIQDWDGYRKILGACRKTESNGLHYLWVDTCCIDKRNSTELGRAINSMYRWYQNANICYAYLSDVVTRCQLRDDDSSLFNISGSPQHETCAALATSRWFTRGWTLQELLAPRRVQFYDSRWQLIGDLTDLSDTISAITSIHVDALNHKRPISSYSAAQKFSWASARRTKEVEDQAYSLLGICDVALPLNYGEREEAFIRLQKEILLRGDQSVLAWSTTNSPSLRNLFAASPDAFTESGDVSRSVELGAANLLFSSNGLMGNFLLQTNQPKGKQKSKTILLLSCRHDKELDSVIGLPVYACDSSTSDPVSHIYYTCSSDLTLNGPNTHSKRYFILPAACLSTAQRARITLLMRDQ